MKAQKRKPKINKIFTQTQKKFLEMLPKFQLKLETCCQILKIHSQHQHLLSEVSELEKSIDSDYLGLEKKNAHLVKEMRQYKDLKKEEELRIRLNDLKIQAVDEELSKAERAPLGKSNQIPNF